MRWMRHGRVQVQNAGSGSGLVDMGPECRRKARVRCVWVCSTQSLHANEHQHEDCDRAKRHDGGDVSDRLDVLGEQDEAERHRDEQAGKYDAGRH